MAYMLLVDVSALAVKMKKNGLPAALIANKEVIKVKIEELKLNPVEHEEFSVQQLYQTQQMSACHEVQ